MTGPDISGHVFDDLAFTLAVAGDDLRGEAAIAAEMCVPDTSTLRISLAATWADYALGSLALWAISPRLPVTLELDVHLLDSIADIATLRWHAQLVRSGRTITVARLNFESGDGRPVGMAHGMFMAASSPDARPPSDDIVLQNFAKQRRPLTEPFATRVGCRRTGPGTAVLPSGSHNRNVSGAINGGLLTVVIEEAALAADTSIRTIESMHVRYLHSVRTGPAEASAIDSGGVAEIEVRDASTGKLAVLANTRAAR